MPSLRKSRLDDNNVTYMYTNIRLPKDLKPILYNVWLKPDLNSTFDFDGTVDILFKCVKPTKRIILHSEKLNITNYYLYEHLTERGRPKSSLSVKMFKNEINSHIIFETDGFLQTTGMEYILTVKFKGMLATDNLGFYKQSYKTKSGQTRYFAVGLFGLWNARKAFPCFDEPEFKAKFQLTIKHDKGLQVVSNMPIKGRKAVDHLVESRTKPTPQMSTYLLQFLVSDFLFFEGNTKSGTKVCCRPYSPHRLPRLGIRVWADENSLNYTNRAFDVTKRTLSFYEEYTGIPYPLPKLDLAFIPNYYAAAFEGWGFIGFNSEDVLHNKAMDTPAEYFLQTDYVAHAVARMVIK
ncbi:hypothetical protein QZH41_019793 [Actinostola sp. cb2023]|nr:hypothetical protein QZH41_019793 [Actinostola sp. cb2023]